MRPIDLDKVEKKMREGTDRGVKLTSVKGRTHLPKKGRRDANYHPKIKKQKL